MKQISPVGRTTCRNTLPLKRTVLWASRPFEGTLGRYIGIAFDAGNVSVAIATVTGYARWVPAEEALTDAEADIWAASGFSRRR